MTVRGYQDLRSALGGADRSLPSIRDTQVALTELEALRFDADLVASPESATLAEPWIEAYRATPTTGDELRLPVRPKISELRVEAALCRFLASAPPVSEDEGAAIKDGCLRAALTAIHDARRAIRESSRTLA